MKSMFVLLLFLSFGMTRSGTVAMMLLKGQRILVTGAGRGIGRAIAQICYSEGAQVAIASRTRQELEETASICRPSGNNDNNNDDDNNRMLILTCDVTKEDQVRNMVQEIVRAWGGLDVLINNAGGSGVKGNTESLQSLDLADILNLNVVAVHTVTAEVLQKTSVRNIINISSRAGKMGIAKNAFYVTSKFALEGYTSSLAEELRESGCVVNTLSPGMVNTRSFPKPPDHPGVRTAESIRDGLLLLLLQKPNQVVTGHYIHMEELDLVRAKALPDTAALKPINEPKFDP